MSAPWVNANCISVFESFCIEVMKSGRIPKHIAIIMDGNRRYAKKTGLDRAAGHLKGSDKLSEAIAWCLDLGIRELTVYAFSIENFNRTEDEVSSLMNLASEKFKHLLDSRENVKEKGVKVNIAGRLSLLPEYMRILLSKVMLETKDNNKLRLNIAYAYTGRDEISRAASHLIDGVKNNEICCDDIDEDLISRSLDMGDVDLIIRTSGEVRLSDFMLWQSANTVLYFTEILWPEFTIWNLLAAILYFQRFAPPSKKQIEICPRKQEFLKNLKIIHTQSLKGY